MYMTKNKSESYVVNSMLDFIILEGDLNHCTSQEPHGEKTKKQDSVLGGKTPETSSRENPHTWVGT